MVGLYLHQGVDIVHGLDLVRPAPDRGLAQERDGANLHDLHGYLSEDDVGRRIAKGVGGVNRETAQRESYSDIEPTP